MSGIDRIVLATSTHVSDNELAQYVSQAGFAVFRGALDDVLDRFNQCAIRVIDTVVRITGDCPFSDQI